MDAFDVYLNQLVNKIQNDFKEFDGLRFLSYYNDLNLIEERDTLVKQQSTNALFKGTKPFYRSISKGCQLCGEGKWSCLFITNKCNANCFYCPASQLIDEVPGTQSLEFKTAVDYAEYVKHFNFKGVSFSGGEPLLFFDKTLDYLKEVRKRANPDTYIWLYTNGILADKDKMKKLADAGLNEIRFDIGATDYSLEKIKSAQGIIPNITIEIPAVPEKTEVLIKLLPEMISLGVTNLNLHQLRLTKYNALRLLKHDYTYVRAEKPVVIESEVAALKIMEYARNNSLEIGVNYCSFFFKFRFQKSGFRKTLAKLANIPDYDVTENGFVRIIENNKLDYKSFSISERETPDSIPIITGAMKYFIKVEAAGLNIELTDNLKVYLNYLKSNTACDIPTDETKFEIYRKERIEVGLRDL